MINKSDVWMYCRYIFKNVNLFFIQMFTGVDFRGRYEEVHKQFRGYEGCYRLDNVMKQLELNDNDTILDVGCGKGLFLYYARKYNFETICGIDYSENLIKIANDNIKKINDKRISVECCDARLYQEYHKYNYFFFCNPFSEFIMEDVVKKICESRKSNSRKISVIYQFPFSKNVFEKFGFMIKFEKYPNVIYELD